MKVLRVELHVSNPPTVALVMSGTRLARVLFGPHRVISYAYLAPPWRWLATELPVPAGIVRQMETAPWEPPQTPPPPREPTPALAPVAEPDVPRMGGYAAGSVLTAGSLYVAVAVFGLGEITAASVAWIAGEAGLELGRAVHQRVVRGRRV